MEAEGRFVVANGIKVHYLEWPGQGPPVILLHATSFNGYVWRPVAELLAPEYRVLAVDQRGHGDSDKPLTGYVKEEMAADLKEFILALDLKDPIVVGHSLGGASAITCAGLYPGVISKMG